MEKLHAKLASEFYDKIIGLHSREFNCKNIQYRHWLDILASKLAKGGAVLDLGCGNGRAVKYFVDRGFRGVGIDISDKMLEMAKKHVPEGKFFKNEFTEIEFGPNSFDAVVSFFALNHIPKNQFKKVVIICRKVLKKDGLLLLGMVKGNDEGLFSGFYGKKMQLYGAGYAEKELAEILRSGGYEMIKTGTEHFRGKHFEEDDIYMLAKVIKQTKRAKS